MKKSLLLFVLMLLPLGVYATSYNTPVSNNLTYDEVLVKGNDVMFESRKDFFDEHFNYKKANGMLASEFIFKTIVQEIQRI